MSRPSGPIQVQPAGLLGLLQLKNVGVNPDVLLGEVRPIVDILPLWLVQEAMTVVDDYECNLAVGFQQLAFGGNPLRVPAGEIWFVHDFTLQAILGAGDELHRFRPALYYNIGTSAASLRVFQNDGAQSPIVAVGAEQAVCTASGFYAASGTVFGAWCGQVAGGPIQTFGSMVYTRMRI